MTTSVVPFLVIVTVDPSVVVSTPSMKKLVSQLSCSVSASSQTLKVVIGASGDPDLAQFLEDWAKAHPVDPRRDIESASGSAARGTAKGTAG